jgi:hypothetical protein
VILPAQGWPSGENGTIFQSDRWHPSPVCRQRRSGVSPSVQAIWSRFRFPSKETPVSSAWATSHLCRCSLSFLEGGKFFKEALLEGIDGRLVYSASDEMVHRFTDPVITQILTPSSR